jgi:hypothetical protein
VKALEATDYDALERRKPKAKHNYLMSVPRGTFIAFRRKAEKLYGRNSINKALNLLVEAWVLGEIQIPEDRRRNV